MVEVITSQFPLRLADRSPQILGGGVRFADHLAAFTGRGFGGSTPPLTTTSDQAILLGAMIGRHD